MPTDRESLLREIYAQFNAREADALLERMTPDVDWPNGWEGGSVRGREAVREYWTRQWAAIHPSVEPVGFAARDGGRVAVTVEQTVRSLEGEVMDEATVVHVYAFDDDGLISAMAIEPAPA